MSRVYHCPGCARLIHTEPEETKMPPHAGKTPSLPCIADGISLSWLFAVPWWCRMFGWQVRRLESIPPLFSDM